MHLLNLNIIGYTYINKVWCLALGNLVTVWRDRRKAVLRAVPCCGSLGEGKMNSDW